MAIDFTFPEDVQLAVDHTRKFMDDIVRPAEKEIARYPDSREVLVKQVIHMRKAAQEWGLWLPHMPEEFGGMGLGHVAMASCLRRSRKDALRSLRPQRPRTRTKATCTLCCIGRRRSRRRST